MAMGPMYDQSVMDRGSTGPSSRISSSENLDPGTYSLESFSHPAEVHNLLGPIHTNAARLLDDQERAGVFFVFQDLSIRTEGEFRLKIKLITVAAIGAHEITHQETPILAETWTESFTVYPPKRFPGVPPTTPLSATFGRQGQKLPSRNRQASHGLRPGNGARQSGGHRTSDEYEDEDDD